MAGASAGTSGGTVTSPTSPAQIRNVVLVGPSGSGKTTLLEAILAGTGTISRAGRTTEGTTVSDFDEAEIRQQRSVGLSLAPVVVDGVKINFLDTPGYADFVGDLRAGLRAADAALFVISAVDGVDGGTQQLWEECAAVGMPRAVVVTRLDHPRADFDGTGHRLPGRLRRGRAAAGPAAARRGRPAHRLHRPDRRGGPRLLVGRPGRPRAERRRAGDGRGQPRHAHRGDHRRERGRDPDGPLPQRRAHRHRDPDHRPRDGRGPRLVLPGGRHRRGGQRLRDRRGARARAARVPGAGRASAARRDLALRAAAGSAGLRSGRTAVRRGRRRRPPTRTSGACPWCGSSPGPSRPTRCCTCPVTSRPTGGTRTTTSTSGSARCRAPWARCSGPSTVASPGTSSPSPSSPAPRPATPCPTRTTRCSCSPG